MAVPLLALVLLSLFVSPTISFRHSPSELKFWCAKTPYPKHCESLLRHNLKYGSPIEGKPDFLKMSLQRVQDVAMHAHANTHSLGSKCRNAREKAAWTDCLELYENSIVKINRTLDAYDVNYGPDDAQASLSAALTNLETCSQGFEELGVTDNVLPLMSNNLTYLISNALAFISKESNFDMPSYEEGFPSWVSPGDHELLQASVPKPNVVVAQDGSGNFKTVGQAVAAAAAARGQDGGRYVIYIKAGTYQEYVDIGTNLRHIMLLGDGIGKTIITGSRSAGGGSTTYNSATVAAEGDGFMARGITFKNTAGPQNQQAVAFRSDSEFSVFYQCSFEGYQDTLYVRAGKQFYRECDIYGTVDFIFGNAAAVFQNCNIYVRNSPTKTNTITAQGRSIASDPTGIIIHNSRVTAAPDLKPVQGSVSTYLGRPWQQYSRTVFMKTFLDSLIHPAGWMPWSGNFALDTLYYGEYLNTGPGSSTANRVKWGGYHVITSAAEASMFAPGNFIAANSWLPGTNVPFSPGL